MAYEPSSRRSFSGRQRWTIFFSVIISIAAVSSLVVMLNYLGARYYMRFPWSMETRAELSPQTVSLIKSLTNDIHVVIYYDKDALLYGYIKDLLGEYQLASHNKISIRTVDYEKDAGEARKIEEDYRDFMGPGVDTNIVIFSSSNGTNIVHGEELGKFEIEPTETPSNYSKRLSMFDGEDKFNSAIFRLANPRPSRAYFLEGPKSTHHLDGQKELGYQNFKRILQANSVDVTNVSSLSGSNGIPSDCKLLILAMGEREILTHEEADNVRRYLDQGGRMLALFNHFSCPYNTGLEGVLADWGVVVGRDTVRDLLNHYEDSGDDVVVNSFNKENPAVSYLQGLSLDLILPRSIGTNSNNQGPDAPVAQELAWTSTSSVTNDVPVPSGKRVPLMVAVEKREVKGITDQGTTRIVVVGDSFFLDNQLIISARNAAFAGYAVNWLLGQSQMLQGAGPQHIREYRVRVTPNEAQNIRWIFLGAMPGGVLLFGGLVWLRRRR